MEIWTRTLEGLVEMSQWKEVNVLVTGATGMVGSWLVKRLLREGARVTVFVLDHDPQSELLRSKDIDHCQVVSGDLRNRGDVSRAIFVSECDYIFHLGAQTIVSTALFDPVYTFESNIMGTWNLFDVVRTSGKPLKGILVASSDKAYGTAKALPYDESTSLHGEGPYDMSKSCTDLIARSYFLTYGVPTVIARCGNIYGGGDLNWSRIVPGTIRDLIKGKTPVIRSNGKYLRDYVYVEDAVDAYLTMASKVQLTEVNGEAFNFSREEPISVLDIYRAISEITLGHYKEPIIQDIALHEIVDQHLSSAKAREVLGWRSSYDLQTGLKETVNWYREFILS
jgi:CDP-glucose 4,6-dehydratase